MKASKKATSYERERRQWARMKAAQRQLKEVKAKLDALLAACLNTDALVGYGSACRLCDSGHPKINGSHIPTQRLGMIPVTPCKLDALWAAIRAAKGET